MRLAKERFAARNELFGESARAAFQILRALQTSEELKALRST